ncbi:MAG: hypothetical protein ACRYFR_04860 [Janthinobacterium lividum]
MLASAAIAFAQAGPELVAACIQALRNHPQPPRGRPAYTTGRTASQITEQHDAQSVTVFGPAHLQTLLTGRGPTRNSGGTGEKLSAILAQWAEDKGIQLTGGLSYKSFGFLAARKIHAQGNALFRSGQPSGLLDDVLSPEYLDTLKARIAAGELVAITSTLQAVLGK